MADKALWSELHLRPRHDGQIVSPPALQCRVHMDGYLYTQWVQRKFLEPDDDKCGAKRGSPCDESLGAVPLLLMSLPVHHALAQE